MKYSVLKELSSEERYLEILELSNSINLILRESFVKNKEFGREELARILLQNIEVIIADLKSDGYELYSLEYCGATEYEVSEQIWGPSWDKAGVCFNFVGFSVQLSWCDA